MTTGLNTLKRMTARRRARVGRGGKRGKTAGRGTKGQNARAGRKKRPELRDIIKKLPKRRGFGKNRGRTVNGSRKRTVPVSLSHVSAVFPDGAEITPKVLKAEGIIHARGPLFPKIKIMGGTKIDKKLFFKGCTVSSSARTIIEKAGGSISER
ncbi:MAG: uL15 family ribosomal protein [bacterium]|nr:uL15 family ribosomal protein [bacterium]